MYGKFSFYIVTVYYSILYNLFLILIFCLNLTRTTIFHKVSLLYGMEFAEKGFSLFVPLLENMKKLSPYQLMITYLLVYAYTIDEVHFKDLVPEINFVVTAFKEKIKVLTSTAGLTDISIGVIQLSKFYQQSSKLTNGYIFNMFNP